MVNKTIDLKDSIYHLTNNHPEIINILKELGFAAITNPIVRNTVGRTMTIPGGCDKQKIALSTVIDRLEEKGFNVQN